MATETITFNIDSDLKTQFKIKALQEKTTITNILTEYIQDYVKE